MYLQMNNMNKAFGGNRALKDVTFHVAKGEIHGLLGENGAGKSTLMKILGGVYTRDSGEVIIDGEAVEFNNSKEAHNAGIAFIHQELNLVNDLRVYENLFLGNELLLKNRTLNKKEMIKQAQEIFDQMEIEIDPLWMVEDCDTSHKQLIEIAKALLFESKLIIMDEPTTALSNREIDHLFTIMKQLKKRDVTMIYISHKMPELFEICDSYTVLRDGSFIQSGKMSDINEDIATELLVGKELEQEEIVLEVPTDEIVFEVKDLTLEPFFKDISFNVKKGEVVAITGLHGDGRGELSEALFGARRIESGQIFIHNQEVNLKSIAKVMKSNISMVQRNRKERSIIPDLNIKENLSIANYVFDSKKLLVDGKLETERFKRNKEKLDIRVHDPNEPITNLSGGNQQKIILGRWLELDSDVYILDNPTQGIDVGSKYEIYKLITELSGQGKSILIFSNEYPEIFKIAHRCIVMYRGEINKVLTRQDLSERNVMYYSTGANREAKYGQSETTI